MKYWINTISRKHVLAGVQGGFTQADHGKNTRLKHLARNDLIAFYSPRTDYKGGEPLQAFTAIGRIIDEAPYQVDMTPDFHPWRRRVEFYASTEAPIRPMIETLNFIENKKRWGYPFRKGLFKVEQSDVERIIESMNAEIGVAC